MKRKLSMTLAIILVATSFAGCTQEANSVSIQPSMQETYSNNESYTEENLVNYGEQEIVTIQNVDFTVDFEIFNVSKKDLEDMYDYVQEIKPNSDLSNKIKSKLDSKGTNYEVTSMDLLEYFLINFDGAVFDGFVSDYEASSGIIDVDYQNSFVSVSL